MENKTGLRPCPFCGGNAELKTYRDNLRGDMFAAMCQKTDFPGRTYRKRATLKAAIEAWNRRAEPENRVLTMEELCECVYADDWSFVWLEDKGILATEQICAWRMTSKYFVFAYVGATEDEAKKELTEENGKEWRCWLRKPTAEEMANMPWEE